MISLTYEESLMKSKKYAIYAKKKFRYDEDEENEFKLYQKVRDNCHCTGKFRGSAHSICNLQYKVPKIIFVVIHNGSIDDYHFIVEQLAEEFKGPFECLGENTEKYITFSVPIKKEYDNGKMNTYKIKFIDSYRFMQSKLSGFADNLSEINKKKCKESAKKCFKSRNGLIKKFQRVYQFCNGDLKNFLLLLRKGVYPVKHMDSWERFDETSLPNKEAF